MKCWLQERAALYPAMFYAVSRQKVQVTMSFFSKIVLVLCTAFVFTGCQEGRVDVYVHQDTGCQSDEDCDAVYDSNTYTWCDTEAGDGTCHYQTYIDVPSCFDDLDCDDGDPSSVDTCGAEGCTHTITERQGAEIVVSQDALCDWTGNSREVLTTNSRQTVECYGPNFFTDEALDIRTLKVNTSKYVAESVSALYVSINSEIVASLLTPSSFGEVTDQWEFDLGRLPLIRGGNICIIAAIMPSIDLRYSMGYFRLDLAEVNVTHSDNSPARVVLGANETVLRGAERTVMVSDVKAQLSTAPGQLVDRGESQIASYTFWGRNEENRPSHLTGVTLSVSGGPYPLGMARELRVYHGETLITTQSVVVGHLLPNEVELNFQGIAINDGYDSRAELRFILDTAGTNNSFSVVHVNLVEYRFNAPSATPYAYHRIVRDENPCQSGDVYLGGNSVGIRP